MTVPYYDHLANTRARLLHRVRFALMDIYKLQIYFNNDDKFVRFQQEKDDPSDENFTPTKLTVRNRIFNPEELGRDATYPACYCIHDPEVVADVSLYGNRIQRFFPLVIIGWFSNQSVRPVNDSGARVNIDLYRDERYRNLRWDIGDAYIDLLTSALTMPANIEYFKYPLSLIKLKSDNNSQALEPVTGFAIERIGPGIVDEYPYKKDFTYFHLAVQTSFNQNTYEPREYFGNSEYEVLDTEGHEKSNLRNIGTSAEPVYELDPDEPVVTAFGVRNHHLFGN